ncbi:MAG TPA: PLP-dependent aminotransferase family protein, partial [Pseudonocardiaceae bacterium]
MTGTPLRLADLHASLRDPVMDAMMFLNEITSRFPAAVSFAPGRPYEGLFDVDRVPEHLAAYTEHLRAHGVDPGTAIFQYGRTNGQIHHLVAETVANDEGLRVPPEAVVVTVGAQEGMVLTLRALFAAPDDVLLVSEPCYVGITGAALLLDVAVEPVPEAAHGPDPAAVAAVARAV